MTLGFLFTPTEIDWRVPELAAGIRNIGVPSRYGAGPISNQPGGTLWFCPFKM